MKNERTRTKMLSAHTTTQKNQIFDVPQGYFSPTTLPEELKKRKKNVLFHPLSVSRRGSDIKKKLLLFASPKRKLG